MSERPADKPPKPEQTDASSVVEDTAKAGPLPADRKPSRRVDLGSLSLDVPPGWRFFPLEDSVVGRPLSNVGGVVIKILPADAAPVGATHEMLMGIVREQCGYDLTGPGTDPAREVIESQPAGGESFRTSRDFVRVWYHRRPEGLVIAWFACKARRMAERSVAQLIRPCDKIIASVRLPEPSDA